MSGSFEVRVILDRTSFTPIILDSAVPGSAYLELNNWGTFDFRIPTLDTQATECRPLEREVQLWRDGKCWWWGVIIDREATEDGWTHVQCYGLEWYFAQRLFGPIATNYLTNGTFEAGLSGWTAVGCTASVNTSWKVRGTQSAHLSVGSADQDAYLVQYITVSGNPDQAVAYKASAAFRINPTATWNGPALYERGLYLERIVGGVVQDDYLWEPITNDTERDGSEVFIETPGAVFVPAGQTQTLGVRLYCPSEGIDWDEVKVVVEESVSTPVAGEDAATLIGRVVEYAQTGTGKGVDLNINYAYTPTGKFLSLRAYQFFDHGNCWEAISEFASGGVCDIGVVWNDSGTERTFTIWPGGRGSPKPDVQLDLTQNGSLAGMTYKEDGAQTSTKVRVLGQGTGSTREVGEATDTTETGGLVLEKAINAPLETLIGGLDDLATSELARTKAPVKIPTLRTHEGAGAVISAVGLGDTVPVLLDEGWVQEDGYRRIVGLALNPDDTLEPTVN